MGSNKATSSHRLKLPSVEVPKSRLSTSSSLTAQKPDDVTPRRSLSTAPSTGRRDNFLSCASPVCGAHELCYLCMQRATRNVRVDFSEERRRKEEEQTALLQQYQQLRTEKSQL